MLDTDIYSEILKSVDRNVTQNATAYRKVYRRLTLSAVTTMEIVRGFERSRSFTKLQSFLSAVGQEEILHFDQAASELAGRTAGELERIGQVIGFVDPMIAAVALTQNLELVTGNTAHFARVQRL